MDRTDHFTPGACAQDKYLCMVYELAIMTQNTLVPITIATGITTYIIEGTGGDRGSLGC